MEILIYVIVTIYLLLLLPWFKLFEKVGINGWKALIPIYNNCILFKIAGLSPWLVLLMFLPIINIFVFAILFIKIGDRFNLDWGFKLGLIFLNLIFMYLLVFSDSISYNEPKNNKKIKNEQKKEKKKTEIVISSDGGKNLLKVVSIVFLVYVVLTWFIPTGYFSSGEYIKDAITPIGLFDIIRYPLITLTSSIFILTALVILLIGGLYGVLNKTGAYQNLIDKLVKKFSKKERRFLIITTILFITLSSLTALNLPLLVMVPLFSTVLILLGYNKLTAMMATIGSILLGNLASTYGFNVAGYITYFTNDINDSIIYRVILLVLVLGLFLFKLIKDSKINTKKEEPILYEKISSKDYKKSTNLIIIFVLMMIVILVGMINWNELFGITLFSDIYSKITSIEIKGYPIFTIIIGAIYEMGAWTNYELAFVLVLATLLIGKIYKLSFKEIFESWFDGIKKMLPVAFFAIIVNTLFLVMNTSSTGYTIFPTIANYLFNLAEGFNVIIFGLISFIGSILYGDFPYLLSSIYDPITSLYSNSASVMGIISQSIHGLVQFIAPTSLLLAVGLKYFDIDYKDWFKNTYKFIFVVLLIITIVVAIMSLI